MNSAVENRSSYAAAAAAVAAAASVQDAVEAIRDIYGLDNATYHHAQIFGQTMDAPYVKSTYSAEWLVRYLLRGYIRVDPVVREGFERQLPFDWRELTLTQASLELMKDAAAHGLTGNGFSIPLVDKQVKRAIFSITSNMPSEQWDAFIRRDGTDLVLLAHSIHGMAVAEIYKGEDPLPQMSPREVECLAWSAQGKDYKEIAIILGISPHTIDKYLKTARMKLGGGSITQCVTKAIRLGLIKP